MDVLMNGLLLAATLFAGGYCWVLAGRVRELKSLDRGLGGAIVTLTRQIELARGTLEEARASTRENRQDLTQLLARADATTAQLKLAVVAAEEARDRLPEPRLGMLRSAPEPLEPEAEPVTAPVLRAPAPEMATSTPARAEARLDSVGRVAVADLLPKPRVLPPLESPLRPRAGREAGPSSGGGSEADLIEALSALASGRS